MSYLSIRPRDGTTTIDLNVIHKSLNVIPDFDINITDLNRSDDGTKFKHFFNNGFGGVTFECQVLFQDNNDDRSIVHDWFINSAVLVISTDILDLPSTDGLFIITKNPNRKQSYQHSTIWDLTFTSYTELTLFRYKNDNTGINKAIKKAKKAKAKSKAKKKKEKQLKALNKKISNCLLQDMKYSKKKKSTDCVKYLQKALKKYGYYLDGTVDGWFGPLVKQAVMKFQVKKGLKGTGIVDKQTKKLLMK